MSTMSIMPHHEQTERNLPDSTPPQESKTDEKENELSMEKLVEELGGRRRSTRLRASSGLPSETPEQSLHEMLSLSSCHSTSPAVTDETSFNQRNLRKRRRSSGVNGSDWDPMKEALEPLTDEERRNWKGWVELESDPALFDYILREYGVQNIKIQDVFSLDDESLSYLPSPVYGLIFLFRYRDNDAEENGDSPICPKHVWFANQTVNNACATVAILNIVMNAPEVDLGEPLAAFKESTKELTPPYRGQTLGSDNFIRNIHNSFARRMDILNADMSLSQEFEKWKRVKNNVKKKAINRAPKKKVDEEEAAFHFIAYVPIEGTVWRLDGLQRHPVNLGDGGNNWIALARDNIMQRIDQYSDDGLEYNLISLCRSPLSLVREEMTQNARSIDAVEESLNDMIPDWKLFTESEVATSLEELQEIFGISRNALDKFVVPVSTSQLLKNAESDPRMLMNIHNDLVKDQKRLRSSYIYEVSSTSQADEQAARRKSDHTPLLYKSIRALSDAGILKDIVKDLRGDQNADLSG